MSTIQNALAVRESTALEQITSSAGNQLDAIKVVGEWIAKSGLFGCTKQEQGMVIAIACREEGIGLVQFSQRYHITNDGKLVRKSSNYFSGFRQRGGRVKWIQDGDDGKVASAEFTFEGQTITRSFTIEQAKSQGLVKPGSGWAKVPGNMLRARVLTNGIGMLCPEIVSGEELEPMAEVPELKLATPLSGGALTPNAPTYAGSAEHVIDATLAAAESVVATIQSQLDVAAPEAAQAEPPLATPDDTLDTRPTLPEAMLDALQEKFNAAAAVKMMKPGELMKRASEYLKTMQPPMLKADETLANLTVANANRVLAKFDVMIKKLGV
jgi:hypothetical protein